MGILLDLYRDFESIYAAESYPNVGALVVGIVAFGLCVDSKWSKPLLQVRQ